MNLDIQGKAPKYFADLTDLIGQLSERAIGIPWHHTTPNAAWLLTRYGGRWGATQADDEAALLEEIEEVSAALGLWASVEPRQGDIVGTVELRVVPRNRRNIREAWRIIEEGGLVRCGGLTHVRRELSSRSPQTTFCGKESNSGALIPVSRSRRTPWCAACATHVASPFNATLDWSPQATDPTSR